LGYASIVGLSGGVNNGVDKSIGQRAAILSGNDITSSRNILKHQVYEFSHLLVSLSTTLIYSKLKCNWHLKHHNILSFKYD